ncbi:MFS transporter [Acinetobacter sp. C26M]|uniref:MFS transporter n=1 Tax=unclassified Acinetobacter TaxID=196816 RepID=UPI002036A7CB|nr:MULTISPECIES: MFS transporter [unclassified Acinetobacter]USA45355.1 MFS transporter [Acinetobacter sp. C26M]USA48857.1 MFS transporter [Acinetobacter sp. C26G]
MNIPCASSLSKNEKHLLMQSKKLPISLVWLFAIASGLSVANVYYAQPLLDAIATDLAISYAAVGSVILITQIGCAIALLLLVPLGDRVDRRGLMLLQLFGLALALTAVSITQTTLGLFASMFAVGMLGTAMTQGLIAYAASVAESHERGYVVGTAQSGVFIGLLLARVFAGGISDLAGWRSVYFCAAALMLMIALPLWKSLPVRSNTLNTLGYPHLILSMLTLLYQNKLLQIRGILALLMFAVFNIFWSALALLLSSPPYQYSHTAIGAFGLVGVLGALMATKAGQWADQGFAQRTSAFALVVILLSWLAFTQIEYSIVALIIGILLLDLGGQALHVTNQSMILQTGHDNQSRLIGLYMLFYAAGSGLGAISTTMVYAKAGWYGVCLLGACGSLIAFLFWWRTRNLK